MENNDTIKLSFAKNLDKFNFNSLISVPIDTNVNIKTILNLDSTILEKKIDYYSGKATISGKILLNILYVDTDNMTNTISETQTFNQTITNPAITTESYIVVSEIKIVNSVVSNVGSLKVNCEVSFDPILYLNLSMSNNVANYENLVIKKNLVQACTISDVIDTKFEYTTNLETKDSISKLLCYNSHFASSNIVSSEEFAIVEGKLFCELLYETSTGETVNIKTISDKVTVKAELPINNLSQENLLDLSFECCANLDNIQTEIEDNQTVITICHTIKANGVVFKPISVDVVEDLYSTDNEIEPTFVNRDFNKINNCDHFSEKISGDSAINDNDPAIDEIVANLNIVPEITNSYLKDGNIVVEGLISSQIIYLDENHEFKAKQTELPFVSNTNISCEKLDCKHIEIAVTDSKAKAKRGSIIELEYDIYISICCYEKNSFNMVDNLTMGKALDFSMYDYQIYIAKPEETCWELCKRIKITPEQLECYNKNLPPVMEGGEKIIIKR